MCYLHDFFKSLLTFLIICMSLPKHLSVQILHCNLILKHSPVIDDSSLSRQPSLISISITWCFWISNGFILLVSVHTYTRTNTDIDRLTHKHTTEFFSLHAFIKYALSKISFLSKCSFHSVAISWFRALEVANHFGPGKLFPKNNYRWIYVGFMACQLLLGYLMQK